MSVSFSCTTLPYNSVLLQLLRHNNINLHPPLLIILSFSRPRVKIPFFRLSKINVSSNRELCTTVPKAYLLQSTFFLSQYCRKGLCQSYIIRVFGGKWHQKPYSSTYCAPWSAERLVVIRRSYNPVADFAIFRMFHSRPSLPHNSILLQLLRHNTILVHPPLFLQLLQLTTTD